MILKTGVKEKEKLLTEEILCPCDNVSHETFRKAVLASPRASFEAVCEDSVVGQKCTSCLLDAESIFSEATSRQGDAVDDIRRARRRFTLSKHDIYAAIDRLSPKTPFVRDSIMPIIAGRGVRTVVSISNAMIKAIGARSPDFRIQADMYDGTGTIYRSQEALVTVGNRVDLDTSAGLSEADGEHFVTGSCRVRLEACSPGYFGTIRPHFAVITPLAMTAVHGQGRGRTGSILTTVQGSAAETQFVSAVNCTKVPGELVVKCHRDEQLVDQQSLHVPAGGACLVPLKPVSDATATVPRPLTVHSTSDVEMRFHMMVSYGDPPRISFDHI